MSSIKSMSMKECVGVVGVESKAGGSVVVSLCSEVDRLLMSAVEDSVRKAVLKCAEQYNFDGEEALRMLCLSNISVSRNTKEAVSSKPKPKAKSPKVAKVVVSKSLFPLPYNGELNDWCCHALRPNGGLYTQCTISRKGDALYCKSCESKCVSGVPEYGTIEQRMAVSAFEFVDPKGRKPIAYAKVMKKYKVSQEQVLEEAGKLNISIDLNHFLDVTGGQGQGQGRPKKVKKSVIIEGTEDDVFAALVADVNCSEMPDEVNEDVSALILAAEQAEEDDKKAKKEAEEEAKKAKKEAEEEAKKAKKEAEEEAKRLKEEQRIKEKEEKEAKKAAEEEAKKAKKEAEEEAKKAKKAAEEEAKRLKEEQRIKEKEEKEAKKAAEEEAKKAKKEAEEEAKKLKEEQRLKEKQEKEAKKTDKVKPEEDEDEEPDVVKKIEVDGKKYLKSKKTGIVYDYTDYVKNGEQTVVGKWNENKNKIDFTKETNDSEESEEDYDE